MMATKSMMMIVTLALFCQTPQTLAQMNSIKPMIVGGTQSLPGEHPYIVSLQDSEGHFCGGSLISSNWVLTAAHCVGAGTYSGVAQVVIGLHDQRDMQGAEVFKPVKVLIHKNNVRLKYHYDFALIQLDGNSSYSPIELNSKEISIPSLKSSKKIMATVAGWGAIEEGNPNLPSVLRHVQVPLVSQNDCNTAKAYDGDIDNTMLCAGYPAGVKDACQADSGGPLVVRENGKDLLIGVVSWGEGCAAPNKYGVYGKVNKALPWIKEVTGL